MKYEYEKTGAVQLEIFANSGFEQVKHMAREIIELRKKVELEWREFNSEGSRVVCCWCGANLIDPTTEGKHSFRYCT